MIRTGHTILPHCANNGYNRDNPYCKQCGFSYECYNSTLNNFERFVQNDTEKKNQILCRMLYHTKIK